MVDQTHLIDPTINYYDVIGVSQKSDIDEIKRAYHKLAMKHHPDRGGDVSTMQSINEAYNILREEDNREYYDRIREEYEAEMAWSFQQRNRKTRTKKPNTDFFDSIRNMTLRNFIVDSLEIFQQQMGVKIPKTALNNWAYAVKYVYRTWKAQKEQGNVGYISFGGIRMPRKQITDGDSLYRE